MLEESALPRIHTRPPVSLHLSEVDGAEVVRGVVEQLRPLAQRRSVEVVLRWYERTAVRQEIKEAAALAATLLRTSLEQRRAQLVQEQGFLFDDLEEMA